MLTQLQHQFHRPISRGFRSSKRDQDRQYPRQHSKLSQSLCELSTQQLIKHIVLLKDKDTVLRLLEDVKARENTQRARSYIEIFTNVFSNRLQTCFNYFQSHGLDVNKQEQSQFFEALETLFRKSQISISWEFFMKIWLHIKNAKDFNNFHRICSILTSITLYSSMRNFGKVATSSIKNIVVIVEQHIKQIQNKVAFEGEKIAIFENWGQLSEQQKVIIHFHLIRLCQMLKKDEMQASLKEKLDEQIESLLKSQQCSLLLMVLSKFPNLCKKLYEKLLTEMQQCTVDVQNKRIKIKSDILNEKSINLQTMITIFGQKDISPKIISQNSIIFTQQGIYTYLDLDVLELIERNIINKQPSFKIDVLYTIKTILVKILENIQSDLQVWKVNLGTVEKIQKNKFVCKIFQLFVKYFYLTGSQIKTRDVESFYDDHSIDLILKYIMSGLDENSIKRQQITEQVLSDVISLSSLYIVRVKNKNPQIKLKMLKNSMKILDILGYIPKNWRTVKHARLLIQVWISEYEVQEENMKRLTDMLFEALFSSQFVFIKQSVYVFLKPEKQNEKYKNYFSDCALKKVQEFAASLDSDQNFINDEKLCLEKNKFVFKFCTLLLGNVKLTNAQIVAKIFSQIYLKYAHHLKWIYPLRLWILYHYKINIDSELVIKLAQNIEKKILENQIFSNSNIDAIEYFQNSTTQNLNIQKLNALIEEIQQLQNILDLKSFENLMSRQAYESVIYGVLKPLSDWCSQIYVKSGQRLLQSEQKANQLKNAIFTSLFKKKQSIYARINDCRNKMSLTFRLYLCNVQVMTKSEEVHNLSRIVGNLLNNLCQNQLQNYKRLSILRVVNIISGMGYINSKFHLVVQQVLNRSLAYNSLQIILRKNNRVHLSLNIAIPLLNTIKDNLEKLIVNLTFDNKKKGEDELEYTQILQGNRLSQLIEKFWKNSRKNDIVSNQITNLSNETLSFIFLPAIKNNKIELEKVGFGYYLQQINVIFNSQICEKYINDHMDKILKIFKHKNTRPLSLGMREFHFDSIVEQDNVDFSSFEIQAFQFKQFRIETSKIIKKFLDKFPIIFYKEQSQNSLRTLNAIINFILQISKFTENPNQQSKVSVEEMLIKLLKQGHQCFLKFLNETKENKNQNTTKQVENKQDARTKKLALLDDDDDLQSRRERIQRYIRLREEKKIKPSQSKLFCFFNVLAQVEKQKQQIVKKCFQMGIQVDLLKFLPLATKQQTYEVNEICDFICQTLPTAEAHGDQTQFKELIKYYRLIVNSIQNIQFKNLDCVTKLCEKLINQTKNFHKKSYTEFSQELLNRIKNIIFKCFELPYKMERGNLSKLFIAIMDANLEYSESMTEFNIKNTFINIYQAATFTEVKDKSNKYSVKTTVNSERIQIPIKQFKEIFSKSLQNKDTEFYQTLRPIIEGWRRSNQTLVYSKGLQKLVKFDKTDKSFISYTVPQQVKSLLTQIVQKFSKLRVIGSRQVINRVEKQKNLQSKQKIESTAQFFQKINPISKNIFNYLDTLEQIIKSNQLILPFLSQIPVKNMEGDVLPFLDFIIQICINEKIDSIIKFLTHFLCNNGLYFDYCRRITYSQYVSAKILIKIIESLKKYKGNLQIVNQIIYFASVCLGIKNFNNMSSLPISQDNQESLLSVIEELLKQNQQVQNINSPIKLLYEQCYYLMCRHSHIEKIKQKNSLIESSRNNQFINGQLFLILKEKQGRSKFSYEDSDQSQFGEYFSRGGQISQSGVDLNKYLNKVIGIQNINGFKWKNLGQCLQVLSNNLAIETSFFQKYVPLSDYQQKIDLKDQISPEILSSYYKNIQKLKRKPKQRRYRRRFQQQDKKIIDTKSVSVVSELRSFYKRLIKLLPASKYVITQKQVKYKDQWQSQEDFEVFSPTRNQLQQLRQSQERRNRDEEQRGSEQQLITNPIFISMLESIKKNSHEFQEEVSPRKNESKKVEDFQDEPIPFTLKKSKSTTQNTIKIQEVVDIKKENYQKLEAMSYADRVQFLTNEADDNYFLNLPSEYSTQIWQQAQLLKLQRRRLVAEKNNIRLRRGQNDEFRRYVQIKRKKKVSNVQKTIYDALSTTDQVNFSEETVKNILKCLYIKALFKISSRISGDFDELGCGKGINLLLETKRNNIKFKVLTTLIIMMKNLQKLKVSYFMKDQNGQWKKQQKPQRVTFEESKSKFINEILDLIKSSLNRCLFNNDQLVCTPLLKDQYYSDILPEEVKSQFCFQVENYDNSYYLPFNELLSIALENNHELMAVLITKKINIPEALIRKIFQLISTNKITCKKFYQNLNLISQHPLLISMFKQKYSIETPPNFQLLGKVLKYKFGQIQCAKLLHQKALKQYKKTYNEYLREIFRLYTPHELNTNEELKKYKKIYFNIIQDLYKSGENILENPVYGIVKAPQLLDYKTKLTIFKSDSIFERSDIYSSIDSHELHIDTTNVFASAYNQIMRLEPEQFKGSLSVKFSKSTSRGSGMLKHLIQKIFQQMFKNSEMFIAVEVQDMFQPSKYAAFENPDYLNCYKFLGRILALCIIQQITFPAFFTKTFYKMLLNKKPNWRDLQQVNSVMYQYIRNTHNMFQQSPDAEIAQQADLYFYYKGKDMIGRQFEYQLKQNGKNILVCNENFKQYQDLVTKCFLIDFCQKEYQKIKQGFDEVIPLQKLSIFSEEDLEKLISGIPDIDRSQFKEKCDIQGYKKQDQEIEWFMKYVDQCSKQELAQLVTYFYGLSKLPAGGFESIKVSLIKLAETNTYPRSGLCGGLTIKLPRYTSEQIFKKRLQEAIDMSKKGEGLMEH